MRRCLQLLLFVLALSAAAFNTAGALQCLHASSFVESRFNNSDPCASYHTGCYEQLRTDDVRRVLEYKAFCAKGDECDTDKEKCQFCNSGDNCNSGLLERVKSQYMQCYSYEGEVKLEVFGKTVFETPQVKQQPVFCLPGVTQCHRIKISEPDPNYASGYSKSPNKMSIKASCDREDCRRLSHVSDCLICTGSLCNSVTAQGPAVGIRNMSDEASSGGAEISAGRPAGMLTIAFAIAAAVAAVIGLP